MKKEIEEWVLMVGGGVLGAVLLWAALILLFSLEV